MKCECALTLVHFILWHLKTTIKILDYKSVFVPARWDWQIFKWIC